jgi:hypothetical protein
MLGFTAGDAVRYARALIREAANPDAHRIG